MKEESIKENKNNNPIGIIVAVAIVSLLLLLRYCDNHKYDKYRSTFKGETIGFATRYKRTGKSTYLQFYFYKDEKIVSRMLLPADNKHLLNKYYKVKYDLNNPRASYIILDKELKPDSLTLVKAGFSKTKYYIYDSGVTNKYLERSKWK